MPRFFAQTLGHDALTPAMLARLRPPFVWMHADHLRAAQILAAFSQTLLHRAPHVSLLLTAPELPEDLPELPGRIAVSLNSDTHQTARLLLAHCAPAAGLFATKTLPAGAIKALGRAGVDVFLTEATSPRFGSRLQSMSGRFLMTQITTVFVSSENSRAAWLAQGLPESALVTCGRLSAIPVALGCNETEREELSESFRHRTLWFAAGVPEREEAAVLQAHREALRESHRLALILHPVDPMRGPALRDLAAEQFVTALRSLDQPITPETQIYIVDTEGERGLWYRLGVACFLGGSLSIDGSTLNPFEAAGLGCAIVHGRMYGRFSEAYDMLREARATRMIQSAEALGAAVCTALRPDLAADQAHRGWQVISTASEATETILAALLARCDAIEAG